MIKLFKVKEKQKELAENANGKPPGKKQSAGELRLHKGFHFYFYFLFYFFFVIPSFSEIRTYAELIWDSLLCDVHPKLSISEILPWFNVLLCKAFWSRQHVNGHEQWNLIILQEETTLR